MKVICFICLMVLAGCESGDKKSGAHSTWGVNHRYVTIPLPGSYFARFPEGEYTAYADSVERHDGHKVLTIASVKPVKFATILRNVVPERTVGQRIEYSGYIRTKNVTGRAALWLRVDDTVKRKVPLSFDNMADRPIRGTTEWTKYDIVMDVPVTATNLAYGILLEGNGQAWVDSMRINIVDKKTPVTGKADLL